jgi:uncharacterized membrane protein (DUF4010 family)
MILDLPDSLRAVGTALALGLLVGLQREHTQHQQTGIRTFTLITVLGTILALAGQTLGGWVVAAGLVAVAALLVVGHLARMRADANGPGLTTEMAALLMYGVGVYLVLGHAAVAVAVGGGVAVLLSMKQPLHEFAHHLSEADVKAIMRFALISLVILPVLPNQAYGPYQVLNPHEIWLMVVLIVGISLGGYVALKWFGERAGTLLGGILGGLISSTATTVSFARRTRAAPEASGLAAVVVMIASAIAFVRVAALVGVVAPSAAGTVLPPLLAMFGVMAAIFAVLFLVVGRRGGDHIAEHGNPAELGPALVFGALYALVIFVVAVAKDGFGGGVLYGVAVVSGLTDLDAITLSTARLIDQGKLDAGTGWRLILVAAMANLVFKGLVVALLGSRRLLTYTIILFGLALVGGAAILMLWPGAAGAR